MVEVKGLRKKFIAGHGEVRAVHGIDFRVERGQFFTLLGPSGCGKSTTLRCIAGLERPDEGEILIGDEVVYSSGRRTFVPPQRRDIAMVFQSYAIWPHMTVYGNVAYPLEGRMPKHEVQQKVARVLDIVGIGELTDRPATQLSGGQQQRVALARAIVKGAKVLLLDEPLSNLDAKMRAHMRSELRDLQKRIGITTIYVTHDQEEAMAVSDRIAILNRGRLIYDGSPQDLISRSRGKVWTVTTDEKGAAALRAKGHATTVVRDGRGVNVRLVTGESPDDRAVPAEPTLEDAYLDLMGGEPV